MARRRYEQAGGVAAVLLAFGVGLLVGAEHCAEPAPPPPALACPEPVPCAPPPAPESPPSAPPARRAARRLPPAPPPDARHREALLAWATAQAPDLTVCGTDGARPVHLAVTLHLDDRGGIRDVSLSRAPEALRPAQAACLAARMRRWTPPAELVRDRERLVFGLTL